MLNANEWWSGALQVLNNVLNSPEVTALHLMVLTFLTQFGLLLILPALGALAIARRHSRGA